MFFYCAVDEKLEAKKEDIKQLEKTFDAVALHAQDDMMKNNVKVQELRYSVVRLPGDLKSEHHFFVKEAKAELRKAESVDDIFLVTGDYWDFLNYSLLEHLVDRHASEEVKKEMAEYVEQVKVFRRDTPLQLFSKVYKRKPRKVDEKFRKMVTEHKMDWDTATLEDVERFRNDMNSELSLSVFSLSLAVVVRGSVEITWLVPQSVVAYIQKSIKPSSPCMRKHHVMKLTIDGFICYDSTTGTVPGRLHNKITIWIYECDSIPENLGI